MQNGSQSATTFQAAAEPFSSSHLLRGSSATPNLEPRSEDAQPSARGEMAPFLCISSVLRRLLLQSRVAVNHTRAALLEGEPGTGKHLFAQTMHRQSAYAKYPFRREDARAWLSTDCESSSLEGTLYLDRVDLLAPIGQNLLLNFVKMLQNSETGHFLLLASSHVSLRQLASRNLFLPDLAFRLAAVQFTLPPLREHREDIPPITQSLIDRICRRYQQPTAILAPGALPRLLQHDWPGNVRELASVLESAILASSSGLVRAHDLILSPTSAQAPPALPPLATVALQNSARDLSLDEAIRRHLLLVLEKHRGNKLRAARQLGISRSTLYRLLAGQTHTA